MRVETAAGVLLAAVDREVVVAVVAAVVGLASEAEEGRSAVDSVVAWKLVAVAVAADPGKSNNEKVTTCVDISKLEAELPEVCRNLPGSSFAR